LGQAARADARPAIGARRRARRYTARSQAGSEGRIEVTQCCGFSATEGADVGLNTGTPVSEDCENPFAFSGKIAKVTINLLDDKETAAAREAIDQQEGEGVMKRKISD
jgi:hypothetical protein